MDLLYHHAEFNRAQISHATGGKKTFDVLSWLATLAFYYIQQEKSVSKVMGKGKF